RAFRPAPRLPPRAAPSAPRRAFRPALERRPYSIVVTTRTPRLEIEYCTQCRWLLRAAWLAQELLTTFPRDLGEVALVPGIGGVFEVRLDGETLWNRKPDGFPDLAQLKRLVRDRVAPGRDLGHSDRKEPDAG
ncbi:SelT/SelW/SelH family protein, partial [Actinoplanes cyaneus]